MASTPILINDWCETLLRRVLIQLLRSAVVPGQAEPGRALRSCGHPHPKGCRLVPISPQVPVAKKWLNLMTAEVHLLSRGALPMTRKVLPGGEFPRPAGRGMLPGGQMMRPANPKVFPGTRFVVPASRGELPNGSILSPATRKVLPASHGEHLRGGRTGLEVT